MRLQGKRVVITAAASGMGRAGCQLFAQEGAVVAAVDIDAGRLQELADEVNATGASLVPIIGNLLDPDSCKLAITKAAQSMGGLDVLWNHAGSPGLRDIENLDLAEYATTMDLNIRTSLLTTGAAISHMRAAGGGALIYTSSMAGLVGATVSPVYSAAKFGVVGLAKSIALRYAREGIRANVICPGPIGTPMLPKFFDPNADTKAAEAQQARIIAAIPMGRVGRPIEVARAALWLASDEASFVTGVALPVDGGFTAG